MNKVYGVKFNNIDKKYYYLSDEDYEVGSLVLINTERGLQLTKVVQILEDVKPKEEMEKIERLATEEEYDAYLNNLKDADKALKKCIEYAKDLELEMNVVSAQFNLDRSQLLFNFTADGRIDFRELVKDLAAVFKTRIELRQIGVRDEVKRIGGNGVCGRELCCCSFLGNFETVSIKMAKEQNISLNPSKISGNCGRLMCCLKYEQDVYEDKLSRIPKVGSIVKTEDGEGIVESIETLKEIIREKLKDGDETFYKKFNAKDVTLIKSPENEEEDPEEKEHLKELQELEKLEKMDTQNKTDDDI